MVELAEGAELLEVKVSGKRYGLIVAERYRSCPISSPRSGAKAGSQWGGACTCKLNSKNRIVLAER